MSFVSSLSVRAAFLIVGFIGLLAAAPAFAQTPSAKAPATDATATNPQGQFIQNLGDQAVTILANKKISAEERNTQFRNMLRDSFDLSTIARFVIGRSWLTATPAQQTEYMDLFEKLVIKTYSDRFSLYTGEGFKVRSVVPEGDKDFIVNSDITHPDGTPPTVVSWRVRQKTDKMGIIDVVVEGISMSVTQRQDYSAVLQRNGGDIEALLSLMRERVGGPQTADAKKS